ncbi:MAG: MBL fold metallo-hydrolase [Sarcina sp.]
MKVKFVGMSSEDVTGSQTLVELNNGKKILIDFGMYQSNNMMKDHLINSSNFKFRVSEIDYVIISHTHADHCALLGLLYKRGYKGKVGIVKGTRNLTKFMLEDCAYILSKTAKTLSKGKKQYQSLYELEHIEMVMNNIEEYDFFDEVKIGDGASFEFIPSQHIAKSAQIIIKEGNNKFVYSGDLGNLNKACLYSEKLKPVSNCHTYVTESTYGERDRVDGTITRANEERLLEAILSNTQGITLIPCFSLQRTQEILHLLKDSKYQIYVDSPLSVKITEEINKLYGLEEILQKSNIHLIEKWEDSLSIMSNNEKKVILSSAGMLNAGRSVEWAKKIISDQRNSIIFVGYCSNGTIGRIIQDNPKVVKFDSTTELELRCSVTTLTTFSSHMQREDLIEYLSSINCENIVLHHGNKKAKEDLKEDLEIAIKDKLKTTKVYIASRNYEFFI